MVSTHAASVTSGLYVQPTARGSPDVNDSSCRSVTAALAPVHPSTCPVVESRVSSPRRTASKITIPDTILDADAIATRVSGVKPPSMRS